MSESNPPKRLAYEELRTPRLGLRRPRESDAPLILASFAADPEVTRFLLWRPHQSIGDAEAAVADRIERLSRGEEYSWLIELSSPQQVIGIISLWVQGASAELGFALARSVWGRGLATEAALAVKEWAFGLPGIDRIGASCDPLNRGSARVLDKAGFERNGRIERDVIRPNLQPDPRPSLLFSASRPAAGGADEAELE